MNQGIITVFIVNFSYLDMLMAKLIIYKLIILIYDISFKYLTVTTFLL